MTTMILVVGASGNVGSEVVKELEASGAERRAASRGGRQVAEEISR